MKTLEQGNIAPLVLVSTLLLVTVLSFAVDQGLAYQFKANEENVLEQMRTTCMDASFALAAKSSDNPGGEIAQRAVEVARSEGFSGDIKVWFYEKPTDATTRSTRFWVIGFQLQERSPTIFARGWGLSFIPVASWKVVTAEPYAAKEVWRPSSVAVGCYSCDEGKQAGQITFQQMTTLGEFPQEMVRAAS